ncbi:uncharacterized protein LOC143266003 [Megachile rotundata]|uniref:uncharacterized protein LOC143265350 n=1 Tax=Megachile rotundata TaxID=143995 RepID=UPI003FD431A7
MGRPTKDASRRKKNRAKESHEVKQLRLSRNREINAQARRQETINERRSRLSAMRKYARSKVSRETTGEKKRRLSRISNRLKNESAVERSRRIGLMRRRLANESAEERSRRIGLIRRRLANESAEERSRRIGLMRRRLANESAEERSRRIGLMRRRLANESGQERSRRIGLIHRRLENESAEERSRRIGLIRRRLANESGQERSRRIRLIHRRLEIESAEERSRRIGIIRRRLANESGQERSRRIGLIQRRLENESAEERSRRIGLIRRRLANESAQERSRRIGLIHRRLENESAQERSRRIGLIHRRLENESTKQRSQRLMLARNRTREVVLTECTESRNTRLNDMREHARNRRKELLLQADSFKSAINIFADVPCAVCCKTLYPQQRYALHTQPLSHLIPANLIELEKITTCSRCLHHLKKHKVPSQALWNKMEVMQVPQVISDLSEIEKHMLCRIVPFLKIMKIQNRFSQNWCKGQVVLFARDVFEVAEQLPVRLNQTGIMIVVESLENLERQRQFEIDVGKLRRALEWLLQNNALYKDVRPCFSNIINNISEIAHVTEELPIVRKEIEVAQRITESSSKFVHVGHNVAILRGTCHQASDRFSIESRGKQCTGIAAVACVAFNLLDPSTWCTSDVDYVLLVGDKYYRDCIEARNNPDPGEVNVDYLAVTELLPHLSFNNIRVGIDIGYEMAVNGHIDIDNGDEGFPNLKNGLIMFFQQYTYGILTANFISVAVSCSNQSESPCYWLFDSHARGPKGYKAPSRGLSCCMKFTNIEDLHMILRRNLYAKGGNSNVLNIYSLTPLAIAPEMNRSPQVERIQQSPAATTHTESGEAQVVFATSMLRSIDDDIPNIDNIVSIGNNNNTENDPIRLANIHRKTAPPLNLERERRMEELCWFFLFPDGKNGFGEHRDISITPLDYFQARILSNDKRFQRTDYLFFALSVVEYYRAKASVSVSCRMRQGEHTPQRLVDNMHLTMRNIRGSVSYWKRCCSELIAMVRSLGPPTWFATFSCNDLNWPDMLKALLLSDGRPITEFENLTFADRLKLVQKYPVVIARQFTVRVNALMQYLKNSHCLGGVVIDFWYRIEFQNRGSPHLHMLIWCENVPDFLTNEGRNVIEKVVSCSLEAENQDMSDIVQRVQIHKHSDTCYKDRNNRCCRFGFPRPISETTMCLGPDDTLANNGRFCVLKRTVNEVMVNNYNPTLLKLWEANMDIQPCGNVTAVAYYIAKYASKCEPQDTGDVIKEAVSRAKRRGGTVWNQLFSVSMAILSQRMVSAAECAYRLCHLPLKMSSRKAVFINSCRPEQRYRILRFEGYETSFFNNIFDRYAKRPDSLENLSLAEFAVRYETVSSGMWTEEDGDAELRNDDEETSRSRFIKLKDNTRMRIRNKAAVLRHRYYTLNSDREGYFYNLIVCHIPFRDESTLMSENESSEQCFLRRRHELKPMLGNATVEQFTHAEQIIEAALAQAVALNVVREGETNNEQLREPVSIHADETVYCDQVDLYEDQQQETLAMPEDVFLNSIRSLNVQQKSLLKSVSSVIEKDIKKNDDEDTEQMLLFITGGAGSGKSFILKLLVEHIKRCYNPTVDMMIKPLFIEVASLTGVAARQIFGKTLHSLFSLPIEKGTAMTYRRLTGQRLEQERRKWRYIRWLIIDEISMVSYENLRIIHLRLQEFKMNDKLFGGVNVLLFGDIMQLPPVKGHWCFIQPHWCSAEINLWHQFSFCELTINMRQRDDVEFIDLLNNLRFGEVTTFQLQILCERRRVPLTGEFEDGEAVRIFPTIKLVDEYNTKMTDKLAQSHRMYIIDAVDESREAATYGKRPPENVIPTNVNNCGGLLHTITLAEGSRIMLRRNISISDGLINGAMGIVKKFIWPALRRDQLEEGELPDSVLIKFDDESVGNRFKDIDGYIPISPVSATFQATKGYGDVERRMLPLILSWAVTVHKLQGTTLNKAVIDLGKRNFAKGQIYVALSRVKSLDGLVLSDLAPNKILVKPHDERALAEMERLRRLLLQTNTANQLPATDT